MCVGILMVVFMFLSYSNLFGGETERDITKISVIGIKRENSQVEDFKRGIEEAANAKRVDVEYLEIEEDYDTIKEYIDREIKNGSQALIVFSEKEEQILSYLQSEKKKIPLILVNPGGTEEKTIRVCFDRHFLGRPVGSQHDLPPGLVEGVEGVEKFFLRLFFAGDELHVVHQQDVRITVFIVKFQLFTFANRLDQGVGEIVAFDIDDFGPGIVLADGMGDGIDQVGFAQA